ncbi:hypothetical protein AQ1_01155 [alpha proteobacterium Q-1]|nr:hypothetical protein AQ1_01155 [alpha proteobacterium Q-1]
MTRSFLLPRARMRKRNAALLIFGVNLWLWAVIGLCL